MKKHAGGRPTLYRQEYCKKIIEFFDIEPDREVVVKRITKRDGEVIEELGTRANRVPFFSKFADSIHVSDESIVKWAAKFPDFRTAYKKAKELQKQFLIENGLNGNYNAAAFCFTAKNITDMRDQAAVVQPTGDTHYHFTSVQFTEMPQDDLVALLLGRQNGLKAKSS
jgi:hypothetical protein